MDKTVFTNLYHDISVANMMFAFFYRVSHIEMFLLNWLWQIEIGKPEIVRMWFWHSEIMKFEFFQPVFKKSFIFWPQQPPTEIVSDTSENLDFSWLIPQKRAIVGHFGTRGDQIIKNRKFFE